MAAIQRYVNLNLNDNQIKNAVIQNINVDNVIDPVEGQMIFDTESKLLLYYDGETWQVINSKMNNRLVYKGMISHNANAPDSPETGDLYVFSSRGIATNFDMLEVEIGDYVFYDEEKGGWVAIQGNVTSATTTNPGVVEIATNQEVLDGTDAEKVVVAKYLYNWENQTDYALTRKRVFENQIVNQEGLTLYHHIGKNNVRVDVYNSQKQKIDLEIIKDINFITLKSNVEINGLTVTICA